MEMARSAELAGTRLPTSAVCVKMEETREAIRLLRGPDEISDSSESGGGGPRISECSLLRLSNFNHGHYGPINVLDP